MPLLLDIPSQKPIVAPIPTISTSQPLLVAPIASTSSSGVEKIEALMYKMMYNMDKRLQDQNFEIENKFPN